MVVVWWRGMARLLDAKSVTLASPEEFAGQTKETQRC
jgi:hypothetical protein